jgi:hypothetical protein
MSDLQPTFTGGGNRKAPLRVPGSVRDRANIDLVPRRYVLVSRLLPAAVETFTLALEGWEGQVQRTGGSCACTGSVGLCRLKLCQMVFITAASTVASRTVL